MRPFQVSAKVRRPVVLRGLRLKDASDEKILQETGQWHF